MKYRIREGEPRTEKIIIKVTPSEHKVIKMLGVEEGLTMTRFVIRALRFYLKNKYGTHVEENSKQ